MTSLVYVHIGDKVPEYIYDSIYQTILVNGMSCKIYILVDEKLCKDVYNIIKNFNLENYTKYFYNIIQVIPLSSINIEECEEYKKYKKYTSKLSKEIKDFRDNFWINTTLRFYYIHSFIKQYNIEDVYHIENDVMMYVEFCDNIHKSDKMSVVRDSETRVVPSIIYIPNYKSINEYIIYISKYIENTDTNFVNDMDLLGSYKELNEFNIFPEKGDKIYDGAAIGQYLGGIDTRNTSNGNTDTKGFVNETSVFKPNKYKFHRNKVEGNENKFVLKNFVCENDNKLIPIVNLHIHSKQLHEFSSIFDIKETDIISGDRIISLCDYVLCTYDIYLYHKNMDKYNKNIIIIKDFKNVNYNILNDKLKKSGKKVVKLFVYTHILELFQMYIFPNLTKDLEYVLYIHNSDHPFDNTYKPLVESPNIKAIYAQNIDYNINDKIFMIPIGIANSMFAHGNIPALYKTMVNTYKNKKEKDVYVNINPATFPYRQTVLNEISSKFEIVKQSLPYEEYLQELSKYRFCLCVRGNQNDTHRFWESMYVLTIPIIVNNKYTKMNNYVEYLKKNKIPFYEIKKESLVNITPDMFNEELYKKLLREYNFPQENEYLKMKYYKFVDED